MSKQEQNKKRTGLGRGLGALLEDSENLQSSASQSGSLIGGLDGVNLMEDLRPDDYKGVSVNISRLFNMIKKRKG